MNEETRTPDKKISSKKKLCYSIATLLVIAALIAGLSYAWFYNKTDMATLMEIKPPSNISILGPGGSEMTSLDLNYTDADKKEDQVTVRRVICVQSEKSVTDYKLEIVHTTNLEGLTFHLYPATADGNETVTDGGYTYKYNSATNVSGHYINQRTTENQSNYKYADATKHNTNYGTYDNVQSHAEPLYWLVNNSLQPKTNDTTTIEDKTYNRTYYVCEVTWTEREKETDIFYILAKTA